jgi:hypothetical protein
MKHSQSCWWEWNVLVSFWVIAIEGAIRGDNAAVDILQSSIVLHNRCLFFLNLL